MTFIEIDITYFRENTPFVAQIAETNPQINPDL